MSRPRCNLVGERYGKLVVIEPAGVSDKKKTSLWRCLCDCGKITIVKCSQLRREKTRSCGCLRIEASIRREERLKLSGKRLGENHPNWRGGTSKLSSGRYLGILVGNKKYIQEHRLVMSNVLGRSLKSEEVIHHWDEDTKNNVLSNLALFRFNGAHVRLHKFAQRHKMKIAQFKFAQPWLSPYHL